MTAIKTRVVDAPLVMPEFRASELSGIQGGQAAPKLRSPEFRLSGYGPWPE
jgi:hypothetical protein